MSLTEMLAEIPKLSFAERQELVRRAMAVDEDDDILPEESAILDQRLTDFRREPHATARSMPTMDNTTLIPNSAFLIPTLSSPFPGVFGVFYQSDRATKNALEKKWIDSSREKTNGASDLELLQKTFDRMK